MSGFAGALFNVYGGGPGGSVVLNGTTQYLTALAAQSPATVGNNLFTVEMFIKFVAFPTISNQIMVLCRSTDNNFSWIINYEKYFSLWQDGDILWEGNATTMTTNTWYHICVMRSNNGLTSTVIDFYVNGVKLTKRTNTTARTTWTSAGMAIGASDIPNNFLNASFTNYRLVNGSAIYTVAGFTPPTAPLTNIVNTKLLLTAPNSTTFTDDSSTANAGFPYPVTNVNGATYSTSTPF